MSDTLMPLSVPGIEPYQTADEQADAIATLPSPSRYVYAIGHLVPRFPSESLRKAYEQAVAELNPISPDNGVEYEILSQGQYLHIAREICWVLQISGGIDAYIVRPRTYVELYEFIMSLKQPTTLMRNLTVIIGPRGPIATEDACNGLQLPVVVANQLYYFTTQAFIQEIVRQAQVTEATAISMFERMLSLTDNAGESDEDRAINYITLRYMGLYLMAAEMLGGAQEFSNAFFSLASVTARPARVQGTRRIVEVVFHYVQRVSGESVYWFCRVDVTGQFPFLQSKLSRYYPRPE